MGKAKPLTKTQKVLFGGGFGLVTGWTDVICLTRYLAFGTMMTGNLLLLAKSTTETGWAVPEDDILPTPIFAVLIIVFRKIGLTFYYILQSRTKRPGTILGIFTLFLLALAEGAHYRDSLFKADHDVFPKRWNVFIVSLGFGLQSAVTFPPLGVPTMLATGHLTSVFYVLLGKTCGEPDADVGKTHIPASIAGSILIGAFAGAYFDFNTRGTSVNDLLLTPSAILQTFLMIAIEHMTLPEPEKEAPLLDSA